jgi:hypothetical protein
MNIIDKKQWTVGSTKTGDTDLRIIQGNYPWTVKTDLGENIALIKSQSKAKTGFAKAGTLNDRDEGYAIATLIAAAPDLLVALEQIIELDGSPWTGSKAAAATLEKARLVIKQARNNH